MSLTLAEPPIAVVNRLARVTRHHLDQLQFRAPHNGSKTSGYYAAEVPEFTLRQHLHALEALAATLEKL